MVKIAASLSLIFALASCQSEKESSSTHLSDAEGNITLTPLPDRPPSPGLRFSKIPASHSGLTTAPPIDPDHPKAYLYDSGFLCGGVAVGDLDGDGSKDLFIVGNHGQNKLYLQKAPFQFTEASNSGIGGGEAWGAGASLVDIDTDGDLDIYLCNYRSPNQLFLNESTSSEVRFTENAAAFGLGLVDACLMPYFCDYDLDGDLDIFVLCDRYTLEGGTPQDGLIHDVNGKPALKPGLEDYFRFKHLGGNQVLVTNRGRADFLLRNDGRRFTNVSDSAGLYGTGFGLSAHWWDYNSDGHPDLYIANDLESADRLYQNNGDGTFTDMIAEVFPHTTWFSMGSTVADFNNDGLSDLFTLDMAGTTHYKSKMAMGEMEGIRRIILETSEPRQMMRNALLLNTGLHRFQEAAFLSKTANSDWSWAPVSADFDEDGHLDLFITNGMTRDFSNSDKTFTEAQKIGKTQWDLYADGPPLKEKNILFKNKGNLEFANYAEKWGLDHLGVSVASVPADFDDDGDLDLLVINLEEPPSLYRNDSSATRRVIVKLQGDPKNPAAIGSRVTLETSKGHKYHRELWPQTGFIGHLDGSLHFGLGQADRKTESLSLTVTWPDQTSEKFTSLPVNHTFTIAKSATAKRRSPGESIPLFVNPDSLKLPPHQERPFQDFKVQPLLPNQYSQLGPGLAFGDIDGNGTDDFYLGGAAGQPGRLVVAHPNGQLTLASNQIFTEDANSEDLGALFFDVDGDNDLDLLVASGSYEYPPGSPHNRNRLYLNDGRGQFNRAPASILPDRGQFTGTVAADDFDHDGDLDLFLGTRMVAGRYPLKAGSQFLVNQNGQFLDQSDLFKRLGLVTSALWSDVDADGWNDLLVTLEWGPVTLFKNNQGTLSPPIPLTAPGWWNSITAGDFDRDGDLDYALGNTGLNTKYKADQDHPVVAYFGDPTNSGTPRFIEAKYEGDILLPVRGKSCSTNAIPALGQKFPTFHAFASSSLIDIYGENALANSQKFQVEELRSGLLQNQNGTFTFHPLPHLAQISPVFGIAVLDVNADGIQDLILAQNFYGPQAETGRFDGGISQILLGRDKSPFDPMPPLQSGLLVKHDATAIGITDLNFDQKPDLLIAQNNGPLQTFINNQPYSSRWRNYRFKGPKGNPSALGTRIVATYPDGKKIASQISGGESYLTQQPSRLWLPARLLSLEVFWPDGTHSTPDISNPTIIHPGS